MTGFFLFFFNKVFFLVFFEDGGLEDEAKTPSESGAMGHPLRAVLICWRRLNTNAQPKGRGMK